MANIETESKHTLLKTSYGHCERCYIDSVNGRRPHSNILCNSRHACSCSEVLNRPFTEYQPKEPIRKRVVMLLSTVFPTAAAVSLSRQRSWCMCQRGTRLLVLTSPIVHFTVRLMINQIVAVTACCGTVAKPATFYQPCHRSKFYSSSMNNSRIKELEKSVSTSLDLVWQGLELIDSFRKYGGLRKRSIWSKREQGS